MLPPQQLSHTAFQALSRETNVQDPAVPDVDPRVEKVARDMEGMFLSMMLKQLRSSEQGEGLFAGDRSDMLGSMFDQYLGEHLAGAGGIGLAQMIRHSGVGEQETGSAMKSVNALAMEAYQHAADAR